MDPRHLVELRHQAKRFARDGPFAHNRTGGRVTIKDLKSRRNRRRVSRRLAELVAEWTPPQKGVGRGKRKRQAQSSPRDDRPGRR